MDKPNSKISIIVPVYKVENELSRCVENLIMQTYENIEIILVDDGSPDNCPKLCDEWAEKDSRVRVIHKENAGLGMARNSGLEVFSGDYVMFVDSDDYIDRNTCSLALKALKEQNTDVCFYPCCNVFDGKKYKSKVPEKLNVTLYEGDEILNDFLVNTLAPSENSKENSIKLGISSCMALYDAKFFKKGNLRFFSEREYINEDLLFRIQICKTAQSVAILDVPLYFYCHRTGTLSTTLQKNHFQEIIKMFDKCEEELSEVNSYELHLRNIRYFMINIISCFKKEIVFSKSKKELKKRLRTYCKNETVKKALREYPVSKMPLTQKAFFYSIKLRAVNTLILLIKLKLKQSKF